VTLFPLPGLSPPTSLPTTKDAFSFAIHSSLQQILSGCRRVGNPVHRRMSKEGSDIYLERRRSTRDQGVSIAQKLWPTDWRLPGSLFAALSSSNIVLG
jgi:hypothetical protein